MAKIVKFPINNTSKLGYKKVRKCRKVNLEDYGQLNMFTTAPTEAKVVSMQTHQSPFEHALYLDEQDNEKAIEFYWKAISAGECVADAYCNLGILESGKENYVKAIDCFANCLKYDPRHFEAHYNLANVYSEMGDLALAKLHYELAIEIEPEFESAYYNLGLVMAMQKDFKGAISMLSRYRNLSTERERGNVDKLIESLQKTMKSKAQ